jgi:MFS family permease
MENTGTAAADRRRQQRRVVLATGVGTTIEWFDFFIYAQAAALVFGPVFFAALGPSAGLLVSLATIGISFLFRPLGAVIAGHYGDKVGRRQVLVVSLFLMGGATTLIGILPTPAAIGVVAPVLLLLLRIVQGLSAGAEWGGAALMAVESAPTDRRARYGSAPQQGAPLGLILATGCFALMTVVAPDDEAFLSWGWRVPFLFSAVLVFVGYFIRRRVEESPTFVEMSRGGQVRKAPVGVLFRTRPALVIVAALAFAANSAASYIVAGGFLQNYLTAPGHPGQLSRTTVLLVVTLSGLSWLVVLHFAAVVSDRIGRRTTFVIGWIALAATTFPLLLAMDSGSVVVLFVAVTAYMWAVMINSGPLAAYLAELFPAEIRYSGVALAYAFGSIFGGAFAPMIATALYTGTGSLYSVGWYVVGIVAVSLTCTLLLRDRSGVDLGPGSRAYDGSSFVFGRRAGHTEHDRSTVAS